MSEQEQQEQPEADDDGVELPADEPGATDELGPPDDEQEAEAEADEPEPEPEAEPEARGLSEKALGERDKKADQSFDTYTRRIATLYEEDAQDLIPCPMCLITPRGFVNKHMAGRLDPEHEALVKGFLGLARAVDLQPDPETQTCATCDGEGQTLTGSKVPTQKQRTCPTCKGYGYTPPPNARQNGNAPEGTVVPIGGPSTPDVAQEDRDEWGEPLTLPDGRENPNYGRMPHRKVDVAPWGKTAGLSAQDAVTT